MTEKMYWLLLIAGLAIFITIDCIFVIPSVRDIGVNFLTDSIFMMFTIIFLSWLINYRANLSWKSVKKYVFKRISTQIFGLFTDLSNFCKCTSVGGMAEGETMEQFRKNIFFRQLEELNAGCKLNSIGRKYFLTDSLATLFDKREQYLNNIETKYSRFLEPKLVESLAIIQDNLHVLNQSIKIREKMKESFGINDEQYFESIETTINKIFKEIYKIYKFGFNVYSD